MTNTGPLRRLAVALGGLLFLASCGESPESRRYMLSAEPPDATAAAANVGVVFVDDVSVGSYFDRAQLVTRAGAYRVTFDEFDVWAEPVADLARRRLVDDLGAAFGYDRVMSTRSGRGLSPSYRVATDILRLDADEAGRLTLDARWKVFAERSRCDALSRRFVAHREIGPDADFDARVSAFVDLFAELSAVAADGIGEFASGRCPR